MPDISNTFYAELARGIEDIATMYKYNIILSNSDENKEKEIHLFNTMLGKQVDGIIFMGSNIQEELKHEFDRSPAPVVLAATEVEDGSVPSVKIDYREAAHEATKMLIEKGHRRIGFVSGPTDELNVVQKLEGYKAALVEAGIEFSEQLVTEGNYTYESGLEAFESLRNQDVKAIFVCNDEMAIGVIHAAQDAGFNVPNDYEVVGFDNTKLASMVRPQLTSVVQPMYDIGAVAMRLLTKFMNKEKIEQSNVVLPHRVHVRQSTK